MDRVRACDDRIIPPAFGNIHCGISTEVQKGGNLRNFVPEFIPIFKAVSARAWT